MNIKNNGSEELDGWFITMEQNSNYKEIQINVIKLRN